MILAALFVVAALCVGPWSPLNAFLMTIYCAWWLCEKMARR